MSIRPLFITASVLMLILSPLLVACGQKGDLYPEDQKRLGKATFEEREKELHRQQWDDATERLRQRD